MNTDFFIEMLQIDSTTGRERELADFLAQRMAGEGRRVEMFEVESMAGDCPQGCGAPVNLMVSWGQPKVVFCTHLDTVPPYIAPSVETLENGDLVVRGRGSCDAKGQIFSMWEACLELERRGCTDFALLLLAGEETGSFGAKAFSSMMTGTASDRVINRASSDVAVGPGICASKYGKDDRPPMPLRAVDTDDWVIVVGEPTDNCMATAAKGTKSFEVTFEGKAFHSGYPQYGCSAVEMFGDFLNALRSVVFPKDEILGDTTWNIGKLSSDNPQNILSDHLTCRVYFRTTFESDEMVCNVMKNMAGPDARLRFGRRRVQDGSDIVAKEVAPWQKAMSVKAYGGDAPTMYETLEDFQTKPVAFGSDAPQLKCFDRKILCGPGSILVAHRPEEHIMLSDIETAVGNYMRMYGLLQR
jgi:acetylornithine deacetylase